MNQYIAAIDQGTTSTRCILFDQRGNVRSAAQYEHNQIYPQPGWVEHDPLEIWEKTQLAVRQAAGNSGIDPASIAAVGVTNPRETTIVWERHTGKPVYNAIVWQDTRTKSICDELTQDTGLDRFREKTGLPLATYFSGPTIKWILDNIPGARKAADRGELLFGNIDTWLLWWLTGGPRGGAHVTDVTNASRTLLMNLQTRDWDDEILRLMDIPRQLMPRIAPSRDPATWGTTRAAGLFGRPIPI